MGIENVDPFFGKIEDYFVIDGDRYRSQGHKLFEVCSREIEFSDLAALPELADADTPLGSPLQLPSRIGDYELLQELGREPTIEETARRARTTVDEARRVLAMSRYPISLDRPIGESEDSYFGDFIEDGSVPSPIDSATGESLKETTHSVLAGLTPREAKVLRMRFGIDMNTDHTLEEVGKQFDVTRERIRQIEAKALRKLRHPSRSEQLRSFLEID